MGGKREKERESRRRLWNAIGARAAHKPCSRRNPPPPAPTLVATSSSALRRRRRQPSSPDRRPSRSPPRVLLLLPTLTKPQWKPRPPLLLPCSRPGMESKQRGKAEGGGGGGGHRVDLDEEDDLEEFRLPMSHRPTENLDTEGLEQASVHTQLTASNVGFRLLQKMGWKTGKGLGKNEQGILEPIRADIRDAKLGVGKQEEDDFFTSEENVQRKKLNIELEETEEHIKKREVIAEREHKIRSEVKEIQKVFFCSLCNKQYKLAHEFESHLSSYDHNHRKRFKEMREMQSSSGSRDDRQKREQQREEKELAKIAQLADAHRKQQKQENSEAPAEGVVPKNIAGPSNQDQRRTLKFGFSKMAPSKAPVGNASKRPKVATKVSSVFGNDSDEDS
uniref:G-patch domain-containing protein n=2 Tax=Setaria italica TaxID=4555 RepID=K3Y7W5_SETIT